MALEDGRAREAPVVCRVRASAGAGLGWSRRIDGERAALRLAPMQPLLHAISSAALPTDAQRIFHGRGKYKKLACEDPKGRHAHNRHHT